VIGDNSHSTLDIDTKYIGLGVTGIQKSIRLLIHLYQADVVVFHDRSINVKREFGLFFDILEEDGVGVYV
jgi:hypothetical protein